MARLAFFDIIYLIAAAIARHLLHSEYDVSVKEVCKGAIEKWESDTSGLITRDLSTPPNVTTGIFVAVATLTVIFMFYVDVSRFWCKLLTKTCEWRQVRHQLGSKDGR
ncbi:hypothetical protein TruAng_004306 [Truncatella angustata]|nr:hypothetical protein TruAng_004306 [Truncatella angustata]